jgi:hypothetical protein
VTAATFTTAVTGAITAVFPATGTGRTVTSITATSVTAAAAITAAAIATTTTAVAATTTAVAATAVAATAASVTTTAAAAITTAAIATTTTAVAATAASVTTAATARSTAPWLSFINPKWATHQLGTLKPFNRCVFDSFIRHLDKCETALTTGVPLEGKGTVRDFAELGKQFNDILLLSAEGKVADKNAHVLSGPGTKNNRRGLCLCQRSMTWSRHDIHLTYSA